MSHLQHNLVLASASPARLTTLKRAGFAPQVAVSAVDEDRILADHAQASPARKVQLLATAKARDIAHRHPGVVIGCDSMFDMDGQVVGKPHTTDVARERLRKMSGTSGTLYTGHCVIDTASGRQAEGVSTAVVHMAKLTDAEIEAYIATGEPLHVAGSFTIDGYGGPFINRVDGDHHGVVGISLPLLRELFAELDLQLIDFWARETDE